MAAAVHVLHYTAVRGIAVRGHQEVVARGADHQEEAVRGEARPAEDPVGAADRPGVVLLVDGEVLVEAGAAPAAVGEARLVVGAVLHGKLSIDLT